ncbi:hypothetical protein NMK71_06845 [Weeksellaceae bacterium KMM 9713]|uniref:Uncharacterized protein n=1 Tax=Profundicola chukchiensis TaxID=2961959 RepID=A0A9X4N054_9FLAO|nr:hypothetical protein [Profundicola chukchiensis]MDG4946127.1 hypothetical protein [Profundicola chukchiensis]MDG4951107.1 hypothetical protein [Profundicola chukchiensis]
MNDKRVYSRILWIGIGIFLWLSVRNVSILLEGFFIDMMERYEFMPHLGRWVNTFLMTAIVVVLMFFAINKIKSYRMKDLNIYRVSIILFTTSVILKYSIAPHSKFDLANYLSIIIIGFIIYAKR